MTGVHLAAGGLPLRPPPPDVTGASSLVWLFIALPLLGAIVLLVGGRALDKVGHLIGCLTVIVTFVLGLLAFLQVTHLGGGDRIFEQHLFSWFLAGNLDVDMGLRVDPLSMTFVLLITGVGSLIHIYSIGYMASDPDRRKFFGYLNLFVASMLLLVLANGFVPLYFGWEGVGLASYLLIGWYTDRRSAATAAKKAFLMNRVGDVGLLLAIFLMFKEFGTTSFYGVFNAIPTASPGTVTAIALLLLLGACGKSGQVPLQAWLPDAMEGPTPVSALIHAATMVTAGVYLIARAHPVFDATETGRLVVTIVGAITLLVGCIAGCAKDDIKKVLAYSTVSQIGYMFLGVGLGAGVYALAIVHLLTHGFFKAGMFLGAGSVMHAMNDDVDMRHFGGLWRKMPITFATFTCGYLAIIGFPFLSGYFSKDPIIEAAFSAGGAKGWTLGLAAFLGAGLTAFYMTRLMLMTFFGEARYEKLNAPAPHGSDPHGDLAGGHAYHPHEAPSVMTIPMIILAIGSLGAGAYFAIGHRVQDWLTPAVGEPVESRPPISSVAITIGTLVIVALGILIAWVLVGRRPVPVVAPEKVSPVVAFARADVGGNALNEALVARPGVALGHGMLWTDVRGVDGAVNGLGVALAALSRGWKRWQNGYVRSYALSMLGGTLAIVVALLLVRFA